MLETPKAVPVRPVGGSAPSVSVEPTTLKAVVNRLSPLIARIRTQYVVPEATPTKFVVLLVKPLANEIGVEKVVAKLSVERLTSKRVPAGFWLTGHVTVKEATDTSLKTDPPGTAACV